MPVDTVAFSGPGNTRSAHTRPASQTTVLTKTVHGDRFKVRVKVPTGGEITVAGAGIQTARRHATKAGTYSLTVSLDASSKRKLKTTRLMRLRLRVAYSPPGGSRPTQTLMLTVKRGGKK